MPVAHRVVRWRLVDLAQILFEDHGTSVTARARAMDAIKAGRIDAERWRRDCFRRLMRS